MISVGLPHFPAIISTRIFAYWIPRNLLFATSTEYWERGQPKVYALVLGGETTQGVCRFPHSISDWWTGAIPYEFGESKRCLHGMAEILFIMRPSRWEQRVHMPENSEFSFFQKDWLKNYFLSLHGIISWTYVTLWSLWCSVLVFTAVIEDINDLGTSYTSWVLSWPSLDFQFLLRDC